MFRLFKQPDNDYKTLNKRILDLETAIILQNTRLNGIELENKSLLDKVLRKIQKKKEPEEEDEKKDLYNGVLIKSL